MIAGHTWYCHPCRFAFASEILTEIFRDEEVPRCPLIRLAEFAVRWQCSVEMVLKLSK